MGDKGRRMVESIVIELTAKGKRSFPGRTMGVAALGIPPETIHVTGIPIDPDFSAAREKAQTRRGLGLQPDLTTVLVSAGGVGTEPVESLANPPQEVRYPIQVAVVCGKNPDLKRRLEYLPGRWPRAW